MKIFFSKSTRTYHIVFPQDLSQKVAEAEEPI